MSRKGRSIGSWKYRLVKKLKHRAEKFRAEATSYEEDIAWEKVVGWLDDILNGREGSGYRRFVNEHGAIALKED